VRPDRVQNATTERSPEAVAAAPIGSDDPSGFARGVTSAERSWAIWAGSAGYDDAGPVGLRSWLLAPVVGVN